MFYFFDRSEATQSFKLCECNGKFWLMVWVLVNVWVLTVKFFGKHLITEFDDFVREHMAVNAMQNQHCYKMYE